MANRVYLYTISNIKDKKAKGISEWEYSIPLAYDILVSANTISTFSRLFEFESDLAIIGDFNSGVDLLHNFMKTLIDQNVCYPDGTPCLIPEIMEETMNFLHNDKNSEAYFLLEPGEIFDMDAEDSDDFIRLLQEYIEAIKNTKNQVQIFLETGQIPQDLLKRMQDESSDYWGLGDFSEYLYYTLE